MTGHPTAWLQTADAVAWSFVQPYQHASLGLLLAFGAVIAYYWLTTDHEPGDVADPDDAGACEACGYPVPAERARCESCRVGGERRK